MFDLRTLAQLRLGMSEVPQVGGQPGAYEEKWIQWFLEHKPVLSIMCKSFLSRLSHFSSAELGRIEFQRKARFSANRHSGQS
jgi:hypothetical protein